MLRDMRGLDEAYELGKAFGGIYSDMHEHHELLVESGDLFSDTNALYPFLFLGVKKCEVWCGFVGFNWVE